MPFVSKKPSNDIYSAFLNRKWIEFASKLIQKQTSIHYVSKLLGHSKIDVTDQAYIHVVTEELRKEVAILDESW